MNPHLEKALEVTGLQPTVEGIAQLERLAEWLRQEAIPSGGLGPQEGRQIEDRHLADSVLYAAAWAHPPGECWDLGAGVGLPGLVLAVVWPETKMVLIDRSAKRCDLARRAARVTEVEAEVRQVDWNSLQGSVEAIVSRAAAPAAKLRRTLHRILKPGGIAVVSGSGTSVGGFEEVRLLREFLDRPSRLLIMRSQ